jgi:hypothetical protein
MFNSVLYSVLYLIIYTREKIIKIACVLNDLDQV